MSKICFKMVAPKTIGVIIDDVIISGKILFKDGFFDDIRAFDFKDEFIQSLKSEASYLRCCYFFKQYLNQKNVRVFTELVCEKLNEFYLSDEDILSIVFLENIKISYKKIKEYAE